MSAYFLDDIGQLSRLVGRDLRHREADVALDVWNPPACTRPCIVTHASRAAQRRRPFRLQLKRVAKTLRFTLRPAPHTFPVFVFGQQRSGTGMLMSVFDWNNDCCVYEEGDPRVFQEHRIRDMQRLKRSLERSGARCNIYKPLSDSHRVEEFLQTFPDAKCIWIFRDYVGVSRSAVRRFPNAHLSLRAVCTGEATGSWFEEGLSPETRSLLASVYRPSFTPRECACLIWWARNRIALEHHLAGRVWFADYDALVRDSVSEFSKLFLYLALELDRRTIDFVHDKSSRLPEEIEIDPVITGLCAQMLTDLRSCAERNVALSTIE